MKHFKVEKALILRFLSLFLLSALVLSLLGCGAAVKDEVYPDMKEKFENSGLLSSNIGIMSRIETGDSVTYGETGSGVIIKKEGDSYLALTCAHVVSDKNAGLLVFTVNTDMKEDIIPGIENQHFLSPEVYDSMYPAEVVISSGRNDLALIRFNTDEDLAVAEIAETDPEKGDRIMCVGNPQNEWFNVSYGRVSSGIEQFAELQGVPAIGMTHTAYMQVGSSGGAAFNEDMRLTGITPRASFSLNGKTFKKGVLIPPSEIRIFLEEMK